MSVSFNTIPSGVRVPLFYAEVDNSAAFTPSESTRSLLIGQMLDTGTAEAGKPVTVSTAAMAKQLFGRGSQLARMVAAYRTVDSFGYLVCIPLADAKNAVAASAEVTFSGKATEAGTLSFYIGGSRVQVSVAEGRRPVLSRRRLPTPFRGRRTCRLLRRLRLRSARSRRATRARLATVFCSRSICAGRLTVKRRLRALA